MIVTGQSEFESCPVIKVVNIETEQARMGNDIRVRPLRELTAKKRARELLLEVADGLLLRFRMDLGCLAVRQLERRLDTAS